MKKILSFLLILLLLSGCGSKGPAPDIAATTLPVFEFTQALCQQTPLTVGRLVTESVSCLHDYTLKVDQVKMAESADTVVISGAGLEEFMEDILDEDKVIDASQGIPLLPGDAEEEDLHDHDHDDDGHHHTYDPHIWLSPENAKTMAQNICHGLGEKYPQYQNTFEQNLSVLLEKFDALEIYGQKALADLSCREMITFHDGFSYFAQAFRLDILYAVEEESGSEASAKDLISLIKIVNQAQLPALFTEKNGSSSAAKIISAETGARVYTLDMAMVGNSYFDIMYRNIDTIQEAMG